MIATSSRSGVPFRIVTRREDRDLEDRGDEDEHGGLGPVEDHYFASGFLTSTITASSFEKSTNGSTWICL